MGCSKESAALDAYIRKEVRSKITNLSFHLRKLEKEQIKSKVSREKKIVKLRAKMKWKMGNQKRKLQIKSSKPKGGS